MHEKIKFIFDEMWREDHGTEPPPLTYDTVLLETGFDSMAFAVFVSRLDQELGIDPFTLSEDAVYPRTFGEFVAFYEAHAV
jgi:acyl carrier protein